MKQIFKLGRLFTEGCSHCLLATAGANYFGVCSPTDRTRPSFSLWAWLWVIAFLRVDKFGASSSPGGSSDPARIRTWITWSEYVATYAPMSLPLGHRVTPICWEIDGGLAVAYALGVVLVISVLALSNRCRLSLHFSFRVAAFGSRSCVFPSRGGHGVFGR